MKRLNDNAFAGRSIWQAHDCASSCFLLSFLAKLDGTQKDALGCVLLVGVTLDSGRECDRNFNSSRRLNKPNGLNCERPLALGRVAKLTGGRKVSLERVSKLASVWHPF